ncbi:hypothetical protein V6Z11_A09G021000 [Gossypium hirsutum]
MRENLETNVPSEELIVVGSCCSFWVIDKLRMDPCGGSSVQNSYFFLIILFNLKREIRGVPIGV